MRYAAQPRHGLMGGVCDHHTPAPKHLTAHHLGQYLVGRTCRGDHSIPFPGRALSRSDRRAPNRVQAAYSLAKRIASHAQRGAQAAMQGASPGGQLGLGGRSPVV